MALGNGINNNNVIINQKNDSSTSSSTKEILSTTKKSINNLTNPTINNNGRRSIPTIRNSQEEELNLPVEELLKLDRYAKVFIPDWLKIINNLQPYQFITPSTSELASTIINFQVLKDSLFPRLLQNLILEQSLENRFRISKTLIVLPPIPLPIIPLLQPIQQSNSSVPSHRIIPQKPNRNGQPQSPNHSQSNSNSNSNMRAPPPPGFKNVVIDVNKPSSTTTTTTATTIMKRLEKLKRLKDLPDLLESTYAMRFLPLLHVELEARTLLLHQANLYAVQIIPLPFTSSSSSTSSPSPSPFPHQSSFHHNNNNNNNNHSNNNNNNKPILFTLAAKSIREGEPPVDLGDLIQLRQLRLDIKSWQGVVFDAYVFSINRASGVIVLRCDALVGMARESMLFNVCWKPQTRTFKSWGAAIESCHLALNPPPPPPLTPSPLSIPTPLPPPTTAEDLLSSIQRLPVVEEKEKRSLAKCWLFPEPEDAEIDDDDDGEEESDSDGESVNNGWSMGPDGWVDSNLNEEQKYACQSIVWGKHKVPFLISGPPGTGKTKTLVESILQILKKHPKTSILVCGASNPSADTLAMRLRHSLNPKEMLRLIPPSRNFGEVPPELLPFCFVEEEKFSLPSFSVLLSKRVIVTTCLDAGILLEARCTNRDLASLYAFTMSTLYPLEPLLLTEPHFGYLLIDEAAQALEADVACAIGVVLTEDNLSYRSHLTICGDQFQLGPEIISEEARELELDVSLLGRLAERKVYREHEFRRGGLRTSGRELGKVGIPFVNLTKNYRSCTEILMMPSTLFYNETLEPFAPLSTQESLLRDWALLPNPGFPILFRGVEGIDEPIDEGASFFNELEVLMVCDLIEDLVKGDTHKAKVKPSEISVISPFRQQVWLIRLKLRGMRLGDVDVGNVEALQGAENRVVIISTVRSRSRFLPLDKARSKGLVHEPRRFNVAMTRAKELLIVVGNPEILNLDPWWKAFTRFCVRNRCYQGPTVEDSESHIAGSQYVSRLESEYRNKGILSVRNGTTSSKKGENGDDDDDDIEHTMESDAGEEVEGKDRLAEMEFDYLVGSLVRQILQE